MQPVAPLPDIAPAVVPCDEEPDIEDILTPSKRVLEATSSRGTLVSIVAAAEESSQTAEHAPYALTLHRGDGSRISCSFMNDIRINESENGSLSLYYSETGKTRVYTPDGGVSDIDGDATATDGDAVFINVTGTIVRTGSGNSLIFNFADGATIHGGSDDCRILLADGLAESTITMGNGNNNISGGNVGNLRLTLGEGDNTLHFTRIEGGVLTVGNGNNFLEIYALGGDAEVMLGDGGNTVCIYEMKDRALVRVGGGSNVVDLDEGGDQATLHLGDGHNRLHIYQLGGDANIRIGHGDNDISLYEMKDAAAVRVGDGNNTLRLSEVEDRSSLRVGDGHNSLQIAALMHGAAVHCGDGDNDVRIRSLRDKAELTAGDGQNTAQTGDMRDTSALSLGSGTNFCLVGRADRTAAVHLEAGKLHDLKARRTLKVPDALLNELALRNSRRMQAGLPTSIGTLHNGHFPYDAAPRWRTPAMAGTPFETPERDAPKTSAKKAGEVASGLSTDSVRR